MKTFPSIKPQGIGAEHSLGVWTRIYLHGVIVLVALGAVGYVLTLLVPLFEFTGSRGLAILLSVAAILLGPPLVGSIVLFGVFPLMGKHEAWRGLLAWDDRLLSELTRARKEAQIVLINWPSEEVRTMGILTATFAAENSDEQLAAVYVPTAPQTRLGYIRVVPLASVEFTDWTLKQWQLYQFTFASFSPERLRGNQPQQSPRV